MKLKKLLIVVLLASTTNSVWGQACFTSANDYVGEGPSNGNSITKGDYDNDGDIDVVISNFTAGSPQLTLPRLYFIENNGDGSFQAPVSFASGQRPIGVHSSDFNNDGNMDVAVLLFNNATLNIILGNGDGTFMAPQGFSTESAPNNMEIADFDGDGEEDIAVTCNTGNIDVFLLSSFTATTVTFDPYVSYAAGGIAPTGIAAGDITGNGELDIVTSNSGSGSVSVLEGDGAGNFSVASTYAAAAGAYSVKVADFNGDLDLDVVTSNQDADNISVLLNDGVGGLAAAVNYTADDKPITLDVGDFNNDGDIDVVTVNNLSNTISVFNGNGDGTFQPQNIEPSIGSPRSIVTGDFNGDTNEDIVLSCLVGQVMPVYLGDGTGTFDFGDFVGAGNTPKDVFNADFDGDGNLDFVVANAADNTATTYLGAGDGSFTLDATLNTGNTPAAVTATDIDGNGGVDVIVADSTDGTVTVFLNAAGTFGPGISYPCNAEPIKIDTGDIDNDGTPDIVVLNNTGFISVLLGNGSGGFGAPTSYATGTLPTGLDVGDVDNDGYSDVVVCNSGDDNFGLYTNDGSGNLGAPLNLGVGTSPSAVQFGDLNNDGAPEIITANYGSNNFTIHNNNGAGLFSAFQSNNYTSSDTGPIGITVQDFDNDGNNDVIVIYEVSTASTGYASLYMGDGSFGVTFSQRFSTGINPVSIQNGDFNNDGKFDYCVVNQDNNNVSIHLNATATITALGPTTFCGGGSVDLQAGVANAYNWSTAETTQTITVSSGGSYSVQTTSQSGWCTSTSPSITVTVTSGPTLSSSGTTIICEGESTTLTVSGGVSYTWDHSLGTGSSKTVSPTTTTTYNVTGEDAGGCQTVLPITVTVNALPDASFNTLDADYCADVTTVSLTPVTSGGTFNGDGVSGSTFNPSSASPGSVDIKYIVTDGNGCTDSTTQTTTVNALPDAGFTTLDAAYCADAPSVSLSPNTTGGTFSGDGVSGTTFNPSTATPGSVTVTYNVTDGNGCSNSTNQSTTVNALPDAGFTTLDADYCADAAPVTLTPNTTGGTFSGDGVSGTTFDPSTATPGSVTVTYNVTDGNGCSNSTNQSTTINALPEAGFNTLDAAYCADASPVTLTPTTSGGTFSGDGVSGTTFDPSTATPGSVTVTYTITDGNGCTNSTNQSTTVNALPDAGFTTLDADYCADAAPVTLTPNTTGGTFSGDGVSGTTFDPSTATPGSVTVTYNVTDGNGCSNSTNQSTTVNALPDASFNTLDADYCADATPVTLTPNQAGGTFSGDGVSGTTFDPSTATPGSVTVTYNITDGNGCTNSTNQSTTVNALPDASFNTLDAAYCAGDAPLTLIPNQTGGTFSGDGVSGTTFDPSTATPGAITVTYDITDGNGCTNTTDQNITVHAQPDAGYNTLDAAYCADATPVTLTPNTSGGTFSGDGVSGTTFDPSNATPGTIQVKYIVTDGNGCTDSTSQTTIVNALPDSIFTTMDPTYCKNSTIVVLTPNQTGGTFSGNGIINGNEFDPTVAPVGNVTITYAITDGNNCSSSTSQTVEVLVLPDVSTTYNQATVTAVEAGAGVTYQWLDCENNLSVIPGETNQSYAPDQNGNYAVIVNDGSCSDTSLCVAVIDVSIEDFDKDLVVKVNVYPNPNNGSFTLTLNENVTMAIYNAVGKLVYTSKLNTGTHNVQELKEVESGIYFIQFVNDQNQLAVKKIIVEH